MKPTSAFRVPTSDISLLPVFLRGLALSEPTVRAIVSLASEDGWIPLADAARAYGVSRETVHRWARAGRVQKRPGPGNRYALVRAADVASLARPQ